MRMLSGTVVALLAFAALRPPLAAQEKGDALELLRKVGESYRNLKSYYFQSVTVLENRSELLFERIEMPSMAAENRPGRLRTEVRSPFTEEWTVSDGQTTWVYMPRLKQYMRKNTASSGPGSGGSTISVGGLTTAIGGQVTRYEAIAQEAKAGRIVRDEKVEVGGQKLDCTVVEVQYESRKPSPDVEESPKTYWIDKARHIVVRETHTVRMKDSFFGGPTETIQTTTYSVARVNEPLPDSTFVFTPPEGAREVSELNMPGGKRPDLSGTEAKEFSLKDLDGREISLKDLRGKIVLLDFWASWCGPCRAEMPHIEKLHRELKDKGLMVLGIDDEPPEKARDFLKKSEYTFPTLVDGQRAVAQRYQVEAIPTVFVIDRGGKISSHNIGLRNEDELRAALVKAGLQ